MSFPTTRPRRIRDNPLLRRLVRETTLSVSDLIYPLFVMHGEKIKCEISSMPGNCHYSPDMLLEEVREVADLGIPAIMLFGIPYRKDPEGTEAWAENGIIQTAVRALKKNGIKIAVITDVCLCEYTSHGHCGVIRNGVVDNDLSLEAIARAAVSQAEAGADMVAPSDMMDGRIQAVRMALDQKGLVDTPIMSYAAKYASSFYGPFREAADSAPQFGDRKGYQMDYHNGREAQREIMLDIGEGADIVMVKPALAYLDVIRTARETTLHPLAAYNVSGEYSMVKAAAEKGWIKEKELTLEIITSIKRAGADMILTYHAKDLARWLK
jgi:porphobilinogen synthase